MKSYWEIPGPSKAPQGPCIAFYKYDGSLIRAEWSRKTGWCKFGSRTVLIDRTSDLGPAIPVFEQTWAESLDRTIRDNKDFRSVDRLVAFLEFFGPHSFAGVHVPEDPKQLVLFDVNIDKKGIMLPRDFVHAFGHLPIAQVVYEGNFGQQFRQDVWEGKYPVQEGVVAKGVLPGKGQHGLWFAKQKTKWWMDELRRCYQENPDMFKRVYQDNAKEQGVSSLQP